MTMDYFKIFEGHIVYNYTSNYDENIKDIDYKFDEWTKFNKDLLIDTEIIDNNNEEIMELKLKYKRIMEKMNNMERKFSIMLDRLMERNKTKELDFQSINEHFGKEIALEIKKKSKK